MVRRVHLSHAIPKGTSHLWWLRSVKTIPLELELNGEQYATLFGTIVEGEAKSGTLHKLASKGFSHLLQLASLNSSTPNSNPRGLTLPNFRRLKVVRASSLDLSPLRTRAYLATVEVDSVGGTVSLCPLREHGTLRRVDIQSTCLCHFATLGTCARLEELSVVMCEGPISLAHLREHKRLRRFCACDTVVKNTQTICTWFRLETLALGGVALFSEALQSIPTCTALHYLRVSGPNCAPIARLLSLPGLQRLDLSGCSELTCLAPLSEHTSLSEFQASEPVCMTSRRWARAQFWRKSF